MLENAKLKSIEQDIMFDIIQIKLANGLLSMQSMSPQEKYIYETNIADKEME